MSTNPNGNGSSLLVTDTSRFLVDSHAFKQGMSNFVNTLTEGKMTLRFEGLQAHTKASTIYVPDVDLYAVPNMTPEFLVRAKEQLSKLRAFVYSEVAKYLYSSPQLIQGKAQFEQGLINALETPRINRRIGDRYLGAQQALEDTLRPLLEGNYKSLLEGSPYQIATALLYAALQFPDYRSTSLWKHAPKEIRKVVESVLPLARTSQKAPNTKEVIKVADQVHEQLQKLFPVFDQSSSQSQGQPEKEPRQKEKSPGDAKQSDAQEVSQEDTDASDPSEEEKTETSSEESGTDSSDSGEDVQESDEDSSEGSEGGTEDSPSEEEEDSTGEGSAEQGEGEEEEGSEGSEGASSEGEGGSTDDPSTGDPSDDSDGSNEDDSEDGDGGQDQTEGYTTQDTFDPICSLGSQLAALAKDCAKQLAASPHLDTFIPYTRAADKVGTPEEVYKHALTDKAAALEMIATLEAEVHKHFGVVLRWLKSLLQAASLTHTRRGLDTGDLDEGSLYKFAMARGSKHPEIIKNARSIFQLPEIKKDLQNTAVAMSLDASSSMGEVSCTYSSFSSRSRLAVAACMCVAEALELLRVPFEISSWSTRGAAQGTPSRAVPADVREAYIRYGPLQYLYLKKYNEMYTQTKWRLNYAGGMNLTYDTDGIYKALIELAARKERRKILFVFSDGDTTMTHLDGGCEQRYEGFKTRIQQMAEQMGIEIFVFYIKTDPSPHFKNFTRIDDVQEIPETVTVQLKKYLLGGAARR